jgi:EAL domain-containing protein (putative c-di-GMP-specific phosphodiesterase class I)
MEFIPIAEETGMILVIGAWVLEDACRTAARWPEPKRLAVNLSAAQLRSDELPSQVADILRRTGLPAGLLELEVTETVLISNYRQALATLRTLRGMGVHIACDDFGTGYSSFSYLQNLAFDRIKIDQSFVRELGVTPSAQRIVHAILAMAHSLDLDVTAEGVETETQLSILRGLGCLEVQGFLLGRPAQSGAFTATLAPVAVTASSMARNTFD